MKKHYVKIEENKEKAKCIKFTVKHDDNLHVFRKDFQIFMLDFGTKTSSSSPIAEVFILKANS